MEVRSGIRTRNKKGKTGYKEKMKCPKCNSEMQANHYHRAVSRGCDYFCHKCMKHYNSKTNKFFSDKVFEDEYP